MRTKVCLILLMISSLIVNAQSVAINTSGAVAAASSILDVSSTAAGVLVPRMTTAQRTGIAAPATGLLVYDTNFQAFWYFDGTIWRPFLSNNTGWTTIGNSGTVNGTNFMGSIDNVSVDFRTNNAIRATLMNTGELRMVGTGTAAAPIFSWTGDPNTGIYAVGADILGAATNGVERLRLGNTETVVNDQSNIYDFRVESNTNANMLFVDGTNNRVGIGTNMPTEALEVVGNLEFSGSLEPNALPGVVGQALVSQGVGVAPIWGVNVNGLVEISRWVYPPSNFNANTTYTVTAIIPGVTSTSSAMVNLYGDWVTSPAGNITIHHVEARTGEVRFIVSNNSLFTNYVGMDFIITIIR